MASFGIFGIHDNQYMPVVAGREDITLLDGNNFAGKSSILCAIKGFVPGLKRFCGEVLTTDVTPSKRKRLSRLFGILQPLSRYY